MQPRQGLHPLFTHNNAKLFATGSFLHEALGFGEGVQDGEDAAVFDVAAVALDIVELKGDNEVDSLV